MEGWKQLVLEGDDRGELGLSHEVAQLYRGFIRDHYLDILIKVYPRLGECLTCPWEEWRDGYFEHYPPYAWELNHLAENFSHYLQRYRLVEESLVDLARYEWAEYKVYTCPDQSARVKKDRYALNPAHMLLELDFDIAGWIFNWEKEHGDAPLEGRPKKRPNILIISRSRETLDCIMTQCHLLDVAIYQAFALGGEYGRDELLTFCRKAIGESNPFTVEQFCDRIAFLEQQSIIFGSHL